MKKAIVFKEHGRIGTRTGGIDPQTATEAQLLKFAEEYPHIAARFMKVEDVKKIKHEKAESTESGADTAEIGD